MPTQEMPDKELDDLFRNAAEEYTAAFEPKAWKKMEQLLDKHDSGKGDYWWKSILLAVALLLVGTFGGWFLLGPEKPVAASTVVQENEAYKPKAGINSTIGAETTPKEAIDPTEVKQKEPLRTAQAHTEEIRLPATTTYSGGDKSEEQQERNASKKMSHSAEKPMVNVNKPLIDNGSEGRQTPANERSKSSTDRATPLAGQNTRLLRKGQKDRLAVSDSPVSGNDRRVNDPMIDQLVEPYTFKSEEASRLASLEPLKEKGIPVAEPVMGLPTVPAPAQEETSPIVKPRIVNSRPRFSIGVMLSPDISSIGLFNRITPGTNAGGQVAYRLSNRLQIGMGAIYSVKLYAANVEDYQVPQGFWTYGVEPSEIDATCKVLDLPVHIRFDAWQRKKHQLFVSTGLSSYIMLSERYNYTYNGYGYGYGYLKPSWSGKNTGQYYFSVANVSVGYERALGRNFSCQVEPFLKLPLGGVGFGKVRLISSGVFLSVKYQMGKKRF